MGLTIPWALFVFLVEFVRHRMWVRVDPRAGADGRAPMPAGSGSEEGGGWRGEEKVVLRTNPAIYGSRHVACFNCRLGECHFNPRAEPVCIRGWRIPPSTRTSNYRQRERSETIGLLLALVGAQSWTDSLGRGCGRKRVCMFVHTYFVRIQV